MSLLTQKQASRVPALYTQEDVKDPIVYLKISCLHSFWLITELDANKELGFGFCQIFEGGGELGYVSLKEIEDLPYPITIVEMEKPLSALKKELNL
ncbi:MAG: DUF2958 domain-containing protein [Campylobacterales bacterium]|nr:DUF2958 domain-containing protein [Campylobacterales bacterium]